MPFREEVLKEGKRAIALVVRFSGVPVAGSAEAERTVNKRCAFCREPIGLDKPFHRITTANRDTVLVHADEWKASPRVL